MKIFFYSVQAYKVKRTVCMAAVALYRCKIVNGKSPFMKKITRMTKSAVSTKISVSCFIHGNCTAKKFVGLT